LLELRQVFLLHACPGPMDDLVPKGFQVKSHEVTLHGLCAACVDAGGEGEQGALRRTRRRKARSALSMPSLALLRMNSQ
jgi:hypothetical protein